MDAAGQPDGGMSMNNKLRDDACADSSRPTRFHDVCFVCGLGCDAYRDDPRRHECRPACGLLDTEGHLLAPILAQRIRPQFDHRYS